MKPSQLLPRRSTFQRSSESPHLFSIFIGAIGLMAAPLFGEISLERGSLSLKAQIDSEYDSNIYSNQSETSDWHTVLEPSANLVRDAGLFRLDAKAGAQLQHFQDHDQEDSTDPFAQFSAKLMSQEDSKLDGLFETFLRRRSEANVDVNTRTRVEEFDAKASVKYFPYEKLGYQLAADFFDQNFLIRGMNDIRTTAVDGAARYHFSPKADVFAGIGERWSDPYHIPVGLPSMGSNDTKLKLGIDGEIWPKVTGRFVVGYVHRKFSVGGATVSGALFDTALEWRPDNETGVTFLLGRDFDTTPLDQSVMRLTAGVEVWRQIREKIRASLGVSHSASNYIGAAFSRKDDTYAGTAGINYSFTDHVKGRLHLSYANTDSNFALADYARFIGGVSVAVVF